MIIVFALAGVLWGIGSILGWPRGLRLGLIAVLLIAVIAVQLTLPADNPLRVALGDDARDWIVLLVLGGLAVGYRYGLRWLRARIAGKEAAEAPPQGTFSDTELSRYARHMMLREIGGPGQKRLKQAKVLVIGAGGLGSSSLLYLAAAGVGTIGIVDDDTVDGSNLQRQVIHTDDRIGMPKVHSAAAAMRALNLFIEVKPYQRRLSDADAGTLFADYDLILDGTDNFDTRYMVNRAATALGKPLISAAMTQWEGQISLYHPAKGGPCYQCVFPAAPSPDLVPSCAEAGVLGPLPGIIGSMMAAEAIKHITGAGQSLKGRIMIYDTLYSESRVIQAKPRTDCPICGH